MTVGPTEAATTLAEAGEQRRTAQTRARTTSMTQMRAWTDIIQSARDPVHHRVHGSTATVTATVTIQHTPMYTTASTALARTTIPLTYSPVPSPALHAAIVVTQ